MFALEISFRDAGSQPEMIFVRRPQALIGASDSSHVVIDDMKSLNYQVRIVRDLERRFRVKPVPLADNVEVPQFLEGVYQGEASLDLGVVRFHITALDIDLLLKETEPPDRAGVRVLRQSCSSRGPLFPALVVQGAIPMVISFVPGQPVYIGRAKFCALRLDSADISAKHARIGYESGQFWVEDLGSTNGTFVNRQQISGRVNIGPGVPVVLGREVSIVGITAEDQITQVVAPLAEQGVRGAPQKARYPVLLAVSEVARPARVVISLGSSLTVGRDPASDMWLGVPHVSRHHCSITLSKTGALTVSDHSTNGTAHDRGVLRKGDSLELKGEPAVLDFGGNVTVAICFDEEQEQAFISAQGSPHTFSLADDFADAQSQGMLDAAGQVTSTWERMHQQRLQRKFNFNGQDVALLIERYRGLDSRGKLFVMALASVVVFLLTVVLILLIPIF